MQSLVDHVNFLAKYSKGNQIMLPFGCDYSYTNSTVNFQNIDKVIKLFNKHNKNMILRYSTPSEYVQSVNDLRINGAKISYPVKKGDIMAQSVKIIANDTNPLIEFYGSSLLRENTLAQ